MGTSFVRVASLSRTISHNQQQTLEAELIAQAGIDYAVLKLLEGFHEDPFYLSWLYYSPDSEAVADPEFNSSFFADDLVGTGVSLEDIQPLSTNQVQEPSFGRIIAGRNASGQLKDRQRLFTLKIFDTSSQINVNNQSDSLGAMLDNLSRALARREPYASDKGSDGVGPLKGLGQEIATQRPPGGYTSKSELIGISNGSKSITEEDLHYIFDYITVYPSLSAMQSNTIYENVSFAVPGNENSYTKEFRSPININTASWPVLYAVFQGLQALGISTVQITEEEAAVLSNRICLHRFSEAFGSWQEFEDFLEEEKELIFPENTFEKVAVIKANCSPIFAMRRLNPDNVIYQFINKADLAYQTTELCFFPLGNFEITSLGQVLDKEGRVQSAAKYYTVSKVFQILTQRTQDDFEENNRYENLLDRIKNRQGFSSGNNVQTGSDSQGSTYVGSIQPLWFSSLTGYSGLDEPLEEDLGGSAPVGKGGNYLFRADFNGSFTANKGDAPNASGDKVTAVNSGGVAVPEEGGTFGDLVSDGVVFYAGESSAENLFYQSRPQENPKLDNPSEAGNFPPLINAPGIVPLEGTSNEGTLMFWFKLSNDWDSSDWRTVFFSNTAFEVEDPLEETSYQMGVQKEIQMKVKKGNDPNNPLAKQVEIQTRSKFFCEQDGVATPPPPEFMPYEFIDFGRNISANINAQEWYHLAIRWQEGNTLDNFLGENGSSSMALSGNFYNSDNEVESTFVVFNQEDNLFDNEGTPLDKIPYQEDSEGSTFAALSDELKNKNRFFLGSSGRTNSPQMTMDDVRVSSDVHWANSSTYRPSRYLQNDATGEGYGVFKGIINPEESDFEFLFLASTILSPKIEFAETLPSTGEGEEGSEENGNENESSEDNKDKVKGIAKKLFFGKQKWFQVGEHSLPQGQWKRLWGQMTGSTENLNTKLLNKPVREISVQVSKRFFFFEKQVRITVETGGDDELEEEDGGEEDDDLFFVEERSPVIFPFSEMEEYTFAPPGGRALGNYLVEWFESRNNGEKPPELNQTREEPVRIKFENDSPDYNVEFHENTGGLHPVNQSSVISEITLGYKGKIRFFDYREIRNR